MRAVSASSRQARRLPPKQKPPGEPEGRRNNLGAGAYLTAFFVPRLNFEVNFSTRPAASTRRFSPV